VKQKYEMTADQKTRRKKAMLIGIPLAGASSFLGAGMTAYFSAMVFAGFSAAIITGFVIMLITKLVFTHKESKKRGAAYGFLGGSFALYFAVVATLVFGWYFQLEGPDPDPDLSIFHANLLAIPFVAILYSVFAFFFGGFLGPLLGAFIGYSMSRNISENEVIAETFS